MRLRPPHANPLVFVPGARDGVGVAVHADAKPSPKDKVRARPAGRATGPAPVFLALFATVRGTRQGPFLSRVEPPNQGALSRDESHWRNVTGGVRVARCTTRGGSPACLAVGREIKKGRRTGRRTRKTDGHAGWPGSGATSAHAFLWAAPASAPQYTGPLRNLLRWILLSTAPLHAQQNKCFPSFCAK